MKKVTCLLAALLLMCGLTWAQTDVLNHDVIGVPSTTYQNWSGLTLTSGAVYAGNTAGGNNAIQMRSSSNNSGIVTTTSAGIVTNITVVWNENTNSSRSLNVYGSNTAYEAASDLYGSNAGTLIGSIACGTTNFTIADEYAFIGIRSSNGALWLDEIQITWTDGSGVTPPSITASNVQIACDATQGAIEYTINNPVDGGVLTAATEDGWLTIGTVGETVPFTCSVNPDGERTATVVLTYTYDTDQTVTKSVTVTQATNPNAPGSEANPYTVAQARAAIDAGAGTQGVYATGIVSAIPTAYNPTYENVTFNMVDEEGDEVFLQAYRCGGDEAANVTVGDVVVVYGNLILYTNSNTGATTYEFAQGCQVVSLTHPVITDPTINIATYTLNVDAEEHEGTINVTYANVDIEMAEVMLCNAEGEPATYDWIQSTLDDNHNIGYNISANEGEARTAYLKVCIYEVYPDVISFSSDIVTVNQAEYVAPSLDYAELPFAFNGGKADIEGTDGLTQNGLGTDYGSAPKLKFDNTGDWMLLHFNEAPGTLLFDIKGNSFSGGTFTVQTSEDGETYEDLAAYTELGEVDTKTFSNLGENVRYIKWIYTEKSQGNVGLGNIYLYELGGGPAPVASITFSPNVFDLDAEQHVLQIPFTYENIEVTNYQSFTTHFYDAEGEEIQLVQGEAWYYCSVTGVINGEGYQLTGVVTANEGEARSGYMKVSALDAAGETVYSNLVTINQAAYVAPILDYAELPFEFNGGRADIENTDGLTQEGLGTDYNANTNHTTKLKFDGTGDWMLLHFNEAPGTLLFDIKGNGFNGGTFTVQTSEDGETYEDLVAYTELGDVDTKTIDNLGENVRYIKWIYTEKSQGNVGLGNIHLYELGGGPAPVASITVEFDEIEVTATGEDDYAAITYENLEITQASDFDIQFYDAAGAPLDEQPDWIAAEVTTQVGEEGYFVYYVIEDNEGEARSAYFKVYALDANAELVYSNLVTVSQEAFEVPVDEQQFVLYGGNLVEGDYIIYYNGKAMNNVVSSGRLQYAEIEPEDNVITTDNAAIVWHIALNDEGYWTIYSADANAYAASTGVKNKAQMLEDGTDDMAMWTVTEISGTYEFVNKANAAGDINANLRNNGTYGFACYSTSTGGALSLYKYTETTVVTYTKEIEGYGTSDGGYYLIASPVVAVAPTVDNGFLTNAYDLYYFDQAQDSAEWRNYKAQHFNIVSGKGYLYASQESTTLTFTGIPYDIDNDGAVALDYIEGDSTWNLIGNPYHADATLYVRFGDEYDYEEADYYVMNNAGSDFELADRLVHPMEGIFMQATAANEIACFCDGSWLPGPVTGGDLKLNIRVSDENGHGDFARVRFGEGPTLSKFMLNENNTKLYFTQGNEEFAVVRSTAEGEMPVNFKAAADGTYTLSINAENMEMEYLHLIDNMTGMDVDLLQTPDYSFEATTNDNAARFTLVFAGLTGIEENNAEQFAFFSNGNLIVNNEGEATLQVIDMAGRIVKSETINGNANVNVNATAGVYMLRLVNGDNVKVQKVVVK